MYLLVPYFTFYVLNNTFPHTKKKGTKKNGHVSCQPSETETQTADDDTHIIHSILNKCIEGSSFFFFFF